MDRYLKAQQTPVEISELHILGVTSMFIASKFEDVYPLKMKAIYERIGHKKFATEDIKRYELKMILKLNYKISVPTILEFLKNYLKDVLGIDHLGKTSLTAEQKEALPKDSDTE